MTVLPKINIIRKAKALKFKTKDLGFTMVELLMVMGILGVLVSVALVTYPASQKRARDTQRKNDIRQYQTALEVFANKNAGYYPSRTVSTPPNGANLCVTDLGFSSGECPADPKDGMTVCNAGATCGYHYISDGTGAGAADASAYVLWGALEQPNANTYWVACSTGKIGEGATVPTTSACPI